MDTCTLQELGVACEYSKDFVKKLGNRWPVAKKLSVSRTFSFLALSQLLEEFYGIGMTALSCVEAIPGLGMAGISWKKHFKEKVNVTINSFDVEMKKNIVDNMKSNDIDEGDGMLAIIEEPNALLHSAKKFNFIYLEAYGTCVKYLESALHVICHRGIICIVSTDLSTLYNKCRQRVQRIYHGHTMKNEYVKELAVRLILANVARAASRWDRGIAVLSSHVDENCVTILVRVLKGATHADKSLEMIKKTAHCRVCNYRILIHEKLHYAPQPDISNCMCIDDGLVNGDILPPIVMLGPVYTGSIFDSLFLIRARSLLIKFDSKHKLIQSLQNMVLESFCLKSDEAEMELVKLLGKSLDENENCLDKDAEGPKNKKCKVEGDPDVQTFCEKFCTSSCPVFFYLAQTHTKKGCNPPKIQVVIQKLRSDGYQACKTSFDPRGIRTSASSREFRKIVNDIATETPLHP